MLQSLNALVGSLNDTMRAAVLGAVATIFVGLLAGVFALLVVWVQNRMARRAVDAQERSIYLTLIERRAKWLDDAILTWSTWIDQQERRVEAILTNQPMPTDDPLRAIGNCRREARWLFGPEMDDFLKDLEDAVRKYSAARMSLREGAMMAPEENMNDAPKRRDEYTQTLSRMMDIHADLSNRSRPYMFVGDIKAKILPRLRDAPQPTDWRRWLRK